MYSLKICHLYPDTLNLYGDRGNIVCMKKRMEWRGHSAEISEVSIGESFTLNAVDAGGQTASGAVYSSSNDAVCTIRGATITAVGSGTATVTVTAGGSTMKCIVRAN